jgi:uncharacterized membrane protein YphA (DoxX/SURF4 family)
MHDLSYIDYSHKRENAPSIDILQKKVGGGGMNTKFATGARLLLGLIYFVFALNGFLNFLPIKPPPLPPAAMAYFTGIAGTGYFMPLLGVTEVVGGLFLLIGIASPLMLVILAPVTLQIFLFHAFFTPKPQLLILPIVMGISHLVAATAYWPIYRPLFSKGN